MPRTTSSKTRRKRKKDLKKQVKGFKWRRKKSYKQAKEALMKAWSHAYTDRRKKKREIRKVWQAQINAASRKHNLPYSKFIHGLKESNIDLNRKVLAEVANKNPKVFKKITDKAKKALN